MQHEERLRIWIEQGNVTISQLFFDNYKSIGIKDLDAMLIMHMLSFQNNQNHFPTPVDFANRMDLSENEVSTILQRLMQFGFLRIKQSEDETGVIYEVFSLQPLWNRLLDEVVLKTSKKEEVVEQEAEGEIFKLFEQEFGRFLSPMECETLTMWLDDDGHSVEIIRAALKEAVLAEKTSLRYIDRILFEWKKKNVKSIKDVERHAKKFRSVGARPTEDKKVSNVNHVPFYNWLEERD